MRRNAFALLAALSVFLALPLGAQTLRAGNGTAAAPSILFNGSPTTGFYRFGADTLGFATGGVRGMLLSAAASPVLIGGATGTSQEFVIKAGLGQSQGLRFRVTDGSSVQQNALQLAGVTGDATFYGLVQASADNANDLGASSNRWRRLYTDSIRGVGATSIVGGAGNMTIRAGTGNSRTMTLQTTTSAGTAKNTLVLGADSSATFLGKVIPGDTLRSAKPVRFTALTAASGTPNSVCQDATTKELLENAASSCVVSARRFKENIVVLDYDTALAITTRLTPSTFTYRNGKRRAIGLVADDVASIDVRLVTYDGQGRVNSVNYEQVTIALLAVVQQQQRDIDALHTTLLSLLGAGAAGAAGLAGWRRRKVA